MNILPKKSWHVLKKENIERVRRDEAKAAEEEKQKQARIALAEQEARTARLRDKARKRQSESVKQSNKPDDEYALVSVDDQSTKGHINFFKDFQEGKKIGGVNADHEAEKEAEKINYEKKIGLLTYLGQSSAESQTVKPWYLQHDDKHKLRKETNEVLSKTNTVDVKRKTLLDPMEDMNHYLGKKPGDHINKKRAADIMIHPDIPQIRINFVSTAHKESQHKKEKRSKHHSTNSSTDDTETKKNRKNKSKHKKKHKKHRRKHYSSSDSEHSDKGTSKSNVSIEKLRAERLQREAAEKSRAERLLSGKSEDPPPPNLMNVPEKVETTRGRYNSQFHPELARRHKKSFYP